MPVDNIMTISCIVFRQLSPTSQIYLIFSHRYDTIVKLNVFGVRFLKSVDESDRFCGNKVKIAWLCRGRGVLLGRGVEWTQRAYRLNLDSLFVNKHELETVVDKSKTHKKNATITIN